ncbi:hypothetical protein OE88DRAFT_1729006 [Heliocybe sulcata]|uniref:Fungal-type protein kinase domain-containing protein n=1 Tax=Heliocybe sulcata TaxID=5364 RepID=A0A5C3MP89_9AGAM|nr:hypothetical protein OE88DRAFT_1729006 [Heliocybe sulcata]
MSATTSQFTLAEDSNDSLLKDLYWELEEYLVDGGDVFTEYAFKYQVPSADIKTFVCDYGKYDGKWTSVPGCSASFARVKRAYLTIINDILRHFGRDGTRQAVDTQGHRMGYNDEVETRMATSPNISIMGCGTHIDPGQSIYDPPHYAQVLAPIEIDTNCLPLKVLIYHLAVYARFVLYCHPTRHFVLCLLLTRYTVRLVQFDRGGGIYSSAVNIHKDPETFVRFILGISSLNESDLGFDPRIYWRLRRQYFKPCLEPRLEYRISHPVANPQIRSRGTASYRVHHEGETLWLKFYWHPAEKVPEWEFLVKAQEANIKGVARMVRHGESVSISDLRCGVPLISTVGSRISDRVCTYILQPMYGQRLNLKGLDSFPEERFLLAYRDALMGSMDLLKVGIIHGDVSPNNILYNPGGGPGSRGVLIDFDMALYAEEGQSRDTDEPIFRVETFRSIGVQEGHRYSHLDELESFFYTYLWACIRKPSEDSRVESLTEKAIGEWQHNHDSVSKRFKMRLFRSESCHVLDWLRGRGLSSTMIDLFVDLQRFFQRQNSRVLRKLDEERLGYTVEEQSRPELRVSDRIRVQATERLDELYERMPASYIKSIDIVCSTELMGYAAKEGCNEWYTLLAKRHYHELLHYIDQAAAKLQQAKADVLPADVLSESDALESESDDDRYFIISSDDSEMPVATVRANAAPQVLTGSGLKVITNTFGSNVKRDRTSPDGSSCHGPEAKKAKEFH